MEIVAGRLGNLSVRRRGLARRRCAVVLHGLGALPIDLKPLERDFDIIEIFAPGFVGPSVDCNDLYELADLYAEAVQKIAGDDPLVVGVSFGATLALLMNHSAPTLAVEPFLTTADLWPLRESLRRSVFPLRPDLVAPCERWLGIAREQTTPLTFHPRAKGPLTVVVGDEPLLPRRPLQAMPSLCSDADRRRLAAQGAQVIVAPGGHRVGHASTALTLALLRELSTQVSGTS